MIKEKLQRYVFGKTLFLKGVCVTSQGLHDEEYISVYFRTDDIFKRRSLSGAPRLRFDGAEVRMVK
jgi:hypothetical protein